MPQRVLHILSSTMRAGVELMVMNLYREIDREKLQFDFVVHELGNDDLGSEISSLGGRVFRIPLLSKTGIPKYVKTIQNIIIQNGPYIAVHAHTDYQGGFVALAAKKAGVPIRICHAHSDTRAIRSMTLTAKTLLGRALIKRYATQSCACSKNAGNSLYGKRATDKGLVLVVKNCIDLTGFWACEPHTRENLLKDCNADKDTRLIGYMGRLSPEKNPFFILDMAAEAKKANLNYRFILVGSGVMQEALVRKRQLLGLDDTVCFLGTRDDVPSLMQCFDMIVVPSLAEGFCLTAAEAQAAGTPVLAASCVPPEADMELKLLHIMQLDAGAVTWVEQTGGIIKNAIRLEAEACIGAIQAKGFDVKNNVDTFMHLYGLPNQN